MNNPAQQIAAAAKSNVSAASKQTTDLAKKVSVAA
jgi:hypothetical protein